MNQKQHEFLTVIDDHTRRNAAGKLECFWCAPDGLKESWSETLKHHVTFSGPGCASTLRAMEKTRLDQRANMGILIRHYRRRQTGTRNPSGENRILQGLEPPTPRQPIRGRGIGDSSEAPAVAGPERPRARQRWKP